MSVSKISLSLSSKKQVPAPANGVKRPRAALHDDDDDGHEYGQAEKVSHFDKTAGGAIDATKKTEETGPLIIPNMSNRDWKEEANRRKRQKSGLPGETGLGGVQAEEKMRHVEAADAAKKPAIGLNLYKRDPTQKAQDATTRVGLTPDEHQAQVRLEKAPQEQTDDERAVDALLGKSSNNGTLVIAADKVDQQEAESAAFRHDYVDAPEEATLDAYSRVPVEQFGAALLRGMGWKDGEGIGSQRGKKMPKDVGKLPERRAALLGIGAKEDKALAQELGAWGKSAKGGKEIKIYNPVLLRDKKTGQMYTEDELQNKREKDQRAQYEAEFDMREEARSQRQHRHDKEMAFRVPTRENGGTSHNDDRRDRRDTHRGSPDSESDEEYHRRKEKERRRRKERERDERGGDDFYDRSNRHRHDKDRHRSRDRDRRRERSRDKYRDSRR